MTVGAAEDDDAVDDSATLSHAVAGYGSVTTAASVAVSVTEDDTAGVTVSPTSLTIAEGGEGTYTAVLDSLPGGDVTVTPSSDNGDVTFSPAELTFTAANWNAPQTVTVRAAEDADAVADSATLSHAVAGYGSVTTAASVAVSVTEDDMAGVTVSPTSLTIAEGGEGTYTAVLDSLPGGDVTVTPSSDNGDVTFSPAELTFTAANWNAPQTVAVRAAEDADAVADSATLSHAVAGYGSVTTAASVAVSVTEDDTAGVTVSPTSLTIAEGGKGTYTAVLDSLPGGDVTVTPSSDNGRRDVQSCGTYVHGGELERAADGDGKGGGGRRRGGGLCGAEPRGGGLRERDDGGQRGCVGDRGRHGGRDGVADQLDDCGGRRRDLYGGAGQSARRRCDGDAVERQRRRDVQSCGTYVHGGELETRRRR